MQSKSGTMARTSRKLLLQDNSYFHVTWKCHNDNHLLANENVKKFLYDLLLAFKDHYRIKIFAYCFMDNHPHIVGHCATVKEFSDYFHRVHSILARYINKVSGRKGQVIMDRFRSPQIETDRYLNTVIHYVDLNPVRAGLSKRAKDYRWSSYNSHAHGKKDKLLDPLPQSVEAQTLLFEKLSLFILRKGRTMLPLYCRSYFIGSPAWVKARRRFLFEALTARKAAIFSNLKSVPPQSKPKEISTI